MAGPLLIVRLGKSAPFVTFEFGASSRSPRSSVRPSAAARDGVEVKAQAAVAADPTWVTTKGWPAMESEAERAAAVGLAAAERETVPLPEAAAPEGMVIQGTGLVAVQEQPAGEVTSTVKVDEAEERGWVDWESVKVQGAEPAWVKAMVWPLAVMVAERPAGAGLGSATKESVLLPEPVGAEVMRSQGAEEEALQAQSELETPIATVPESPLARAAVAEAVSPNWQTIPAWVTLKSLLPMVREAERAWVALFAATLKLMTVGPEPEVGEEKVMAGVGLVAVHAQPGVVMSETEPEEAVAGSVAESGTRS